MRKINLINYEVEATVVDESGNTNIITQLYDIKASLLTCVMHPDLKLNGVELLERNEIGIKIRNGKNNVLLEEAEYDILKKSFDSIRGLTQNDVELVKRVFNAEQVDVAEK